MFRHFGRTSGQGTEGGGCGVAEVLEIGATAVETESDVVETGIAVVETEGVVVGAGATHFVQTVETDVIKNVDIDCVVVVKASAPVVTVAVTGQTVVVWKTLYLPLVLFEVE